MNPIYNTGLHIYRFAARLASIRSPKIRKMIQGQDRAFSYLKGKIKPGESWIWIHASSLGEFEQGRPLIEMIKERDPGQKILLTFFSPSGYEVRKDYDKVDAVAYLPFDTPKLSRRFLDVVNPKMAIFIKYEFWGNYLMGLRDRGVPTYLVSAIFRPTQSFFKWWGGMFRSIVRCFTKIYVQNEESVQLLESIKVTDVKITGDTRLDRVSDIKNHPLKVKGIEGFGVNAAMRLIIGSSWEADEDIYIPWINAHPDVKTIIAPHEFDAARIASLRSRLEGKTICISEWNEHLENGGDVTAIEQYDNIIVDSFGQLSSLYRLGDVAYIGGGFGKSIHNINEAAVYGIPVVFGPRHGKFKEASDLLACGGGFSATDPVGITVILGRLYSDVAYREAAGEAAGHYISRNLGATDSIYTDIFGKKK